MTHKSHLSNPALAYSVTGILASNLREALYKRKQIPIEMQEALRSYKLLLWTKELLAHKLEEGAGTGTITRFDKQYLVVWNALDNRGQFLSSSPDSQWYVSLREPFESFGICNIAYIWKKLY